MKTFIKQERDKRKVQQKDLAAKLSISPSTLATYENTDRDPPLDILCEIADLFGVSLDLLVRGKETDRPEERSVKGLLTKYDALTTDQLIMLRDTLQALLAERQFQAHLRQGGAE